MNVFLNGPCVRSQVKQSGAAVALCSPLRRLCETAVLVLGRSEGPVGTVVCAHTHAHTRS